MKYIQQTIKNETGDLYVGENILSLSERILICGIAGIGKTTLCHHLNDLIIKNPNNSLHPYLVRARDFNNLDKFNFHEYIKSIALPLDRDNNDGLLIIIDGLDEINPKDYLEITSDIAEFFSNNKKHRAIITSRPSVNFDFLGDFEKYELQLLSQADVEHYIKANLRENQALNFISTAVSNKLEITNPLLLNLSLRAFESYATLPDNIYRTIELSIEQLLSSWDKAKDIFIRSSNSLGVNFETLSILTYYLELKEKTTFSITDFHNVYKSDDYKNAFYYFVQSGIFINELNENYSFIHKSFQEYFLVKFFQDYFRIGQKSKKILRYNPQVFEMLVESKNTSAINNYISHTDIDKNNIVFKLVNLINHSIENDHMLDLLIDTDEIKDNSKENGWKLLLEQQDILQKGKELESFIGEFLSTQFNIISRNLHTHNGEFDLVIENKSNDPFWIEFNTDYLVECKYWDRKVPIKEILAFSQKTTNSRVKLGFFISLSGFTKDAYREFENIASNFSSPIIVPITQEDISIYISSSDLELNDFLKILVRKIKYKKKY